MENANPILNFRIPASFDRHDINYGYSLIVGVHTIANENNSALSVKYAQSTMITETREAVDTSESSYF
jgi:hypothetical protein